MILVNFEDHLDITMLENSLPQNLKQLKKLVKAFDKVGFATDSYLGHLTTLPQRLGTGFSLKCKLESGDRNEREV